MYPKKTEHIKENDSLFINKKISKDNNGSHKTEKIISCIFYTQTKMRIL